MNMIKFLTDRIKNDLTESKINWKIALLFMRIHLFFSQPFLVFSQLFLVDLANRMKRGYHQCWI